MLGQGRHDKEIKRMLVFQRSENEYKEKHRGELAVLPLINKWLT